MDRESPEKTILVVEDEGIIAMDISASLQSLGYKTPETINNGAEAIAVAEKTRPDLVLIDILLKGDIDGIEAAVAIKEKCNIPIVYLTANTDEQTFQRAKVSGPFGYLLKPFEERELHSTIETALYKHQTEQELQRYRDHLEELVQNRTAELEKTHTALQHSDANYRAIFQNANDAIFVIGADTRIRDANPGATELTGKTCEEIQKLTLSDLGAKDQPLTPQEITSILQKALTGEPQVFEWLVKNNNPAWVEMSIKNVSMNGSNLLLGVARNISMRKESEQMLLKAKEEAEKANRLKNEFLSNMSHEIRTPMNAVLGMSKIALTTSLSTDQRSYLKMILESGENLLDLLNNVLDYSKIEAGQVEFAQQPFVLDQQIEASIRSSSNRAKAKGIEIVNTPSQIPFTVIGDSQRFRQIIRTLLDNAIKFTDTGQIQITLDQEENKEDILEIHLTVSDTGIGITKDKQELIFDLFTQADASYTRSRDGAGLGLAVINKLVKLMNGNIWVESEVGQGSSFHVTIPFPKGPAL